MKNVQGLLQRILGAPEPVVSSHLPPPSTNAGLADRELLERICEFLLGNGLAVTQDNLRIAHSAFSGEAVSLSRTLSAMAASGEKVTQEWLDSALQIEAAGSNANVAEELAGKLDRSIAIFEQTSRTARTATREYGLALTAHADDLGNTEAPHDVLRNLAEIARLMIERTARIEQEMERSEMEAASLRVSLERARREADVDHLTGLSNRRAFEGVFEQQYRQAQTDVDHLSVAFCDIDHFKAINDTHGHDTGDRVIQAVAQLLARISNDKCHVARHGGEEFVVLFRGLPFAEARQRLDETRERLAQKSFVNRVNDEPIGRVTFSAGIADVFAFKDRRAALKAADGALYLAKGAGRNCIVEA